MLPTYKKDAFCGELQAYDFETLVVTNGVVVKLDATKLAHAKKQKCVRAFITCETGNVRYRLDGGAPTTTEGHVFYFEGQPLEVEGAVNLTNLGFIAITDTAKVTVTYARYEA
jgi:hypothetical protein